MVILCVTLMLLWKLILLLRANTSFVTPGILLGPTLGLDASRTKVVGALVHPLLGIVRSHIVDSRRSGCKREQKVVVAMDSRDA